NYSVAAVTPDGFVQTVPIGGGDVDVTITSGLTVDNLTFGNRVLGDGVIIDTVESRERVSFTDGDGTTWTIILIGDGTLDIIDDDAGGIDIEAFGTDERSRIIITTDRGGDGEVDIDDITVFGS